MATVKAINIVLALPSPGDPAPRLRRGRCGLITEQKYPGSGYAAAAPRRRAGRLVPAESQPVTFPRVWPAICIQTRVREIDRRKSDRRRRPTTLLSTLRPGGRRRGFRRGEERCNQYVDHLPPRLTFVVVSIFVMSATDATCTLLHLAGGGSEINPVMDWMLIHGMIVFLVAKALMTIFGVTYLAVHQNFRLAVPALYALAGGYAVLTLFHAFLIV